MKAVNELTEGHDSETSGAGLVLAEGTALNGEAISWCLSAYGSFRNIDTVSSVEAAKSAIKTQRPAVVLVGESVATEGARELLSELAVKLGETRVVVFADNLTDRQLDREANCGWFDRHPFAGHFRQP